MKRVHFTLAAMLSALLMTSILSVSAAEYLPSPTRPSDTTIIEGTDANGNDLTDPNLDDRLVLTPYSKKGNELKQDYKHTNFDYAMEALTWEAAEAALHEQMTPDMNPRGLTAVSVFYAHEDDDSGIITLPAHVRISVPLKYGAFCEVIRYSPKWAYAETAAVTKEPKIVLLRNFVPLSNLEEDHSDYQWVRIPSELHEDGTLSLTIDQFGSYAIITYRVNENPTEPSTDPSTPTNPTTPKPTTVPESPQTGEAERFPYGLLLLVCAGAALIVKYREKAKA